MLRPTRRWRRHEATSALKESGGKAALAQGREGADRVVSEDDGGLREINFEGRGLESQDASKDFAAHLVAHVIRVGKGASADDDLTIRVGPPTQDHSPTEERGVPCDNDDMGRAGLASEEGSVERAGDEGPEGAASVGKLLEDTADEDGSLGHNWRKGGRAVVVRILFGADDGGEESDK